RGMPTRSQPAPPRPPQRPGDEPRPALAVNALRKSYGELEVLRDLSITVEHGEIFGLLGSNGAGKTTAVETIQGLRRPDAGSIELFGLDPTRELAAIRRQRLVGSQLQSSALPDRIRV